MGKRILIVGGSGSISGVPIYVEHLRKALSSNEIYVMSDINEGGFNHLKNSASYIEVEGLSSERFLILNVITIIKKIKNHLQLISPDVVWANSTITVFLFRIISLFHDFRLIVTYHGVPFGPGRGLLRSVIAYCADLLTSLITPQTVVIISNGDKRLTRWSCPFHKKIILPNPLQLSSDQLKQRHLNTPEYKLVMITRDHYQKNLDYAAELTGCSDDFHLYIYGGVSIERQTYLRKIAKDRVTFFGIVPNAAKFLKNFDLMLLTSRYEGLPFCGLEALGTGLALAMTRVGGFEELAENNSFLIELRGDLEGDVKKIKEMITLYRKREINIFEVQVLSRRYNIYNWRETINEIIDDSART